MHTILGDIGSLGLLAHVKSRERALPPGGFSILHVYDITLT